MLRYAISDRRLFAGDDSAKLRQLVEQAVLLADEGIDFFQIREKDLSSESLLTLTYAVRDAVRAKGAPMQIVLNGPRELAERAAVGWHRAADRDDPAPALSASCHTLADIEVQRSRASMLLFGPVFEKSVQNIPVRTGAGLYLLQVAVRQAAGMPVLALGGVNATNVSLCMDAGAAGVAAIRMFLRPINTQRNV